MSSEKPMSWWGILRICLDICPTRASEMLLFESLENESDEGNSVVTVYEEESCLSQSYDISILTTSLHTSSLFPSKLEAVG
jgi:hypothetical protein